MNAFRQLTGKTIPSQSSPDTKSAGSFTEPTRSRPFAPWRVAVALLIVAGVAVAAGWLYDVPGRGARAAFSLLIGAAFGVIMQRGRFCFYCIFRDYIEHKNSRPLYAVLTALTVGSVGYAVFMHMFLPSASTGRLPPDAHIGPVSWVLAAAGIAFGIGMALSGACVSGHLYRLGEGYVRAPFALVGTIVGFGLGFLSWRPLYLSTIAEAPTVWLPGLFGYTGALALQLGVLGLLAFLLLPSLRADVPTPSPSPNVTLSDVGQAVFVRRWSPGVSGTAVGVLGTVAYVRVAPLGVTSQLGSIAKTVLSDAGVLAGRLNGLDTFAGCVTIVLHTISDNGLLICGVTAASFAAALVSGRFRLSRLTLGNGLSALAGGVLMGWGSMLALGCTVGTLLSGIMASALSGWVFFAAVFTGVWLGIKLKLHRFA